MTEFNYKGNMWNVEKDGEEYIITGPRSSVRMPVLQVTQYSPVTVENGDPADQRDLYISAQHISAAGAPAQYLSIGTTRRTGERHLTIGVQSTEVYFYAVPPDLIDELFRNGAVVMERSHQP